MGIAFEEGPAPGAWPNGTRVRKTQSDPGDTHRDGAPGTVRGSIGPAEMIGYFVEWDDLPGIPVFIGAPRLELLASENN